MNQNTERIQQFKAEVADMRLRDPATATDRLLLWLGGIGMAAGPIIGAVAYFAMSHTTENPLQQRDAIVVALTGVSVSVVGAALFVKAAMAGFLRFWLARICYEQQAQGDRIIASVRAPAGPNADVEAPV
jgi:hypothetical protein